MTAYIRQPAKYLFSYTILSVSVFQYTELKIVDIFPLSRMGFPQNDMENQKNRNDYLKNKIN